VEAISHLFDFLRPRPEEADELEATATRKRELIEKLTQGIRARQLESPAVLFLELNRPLGFLAGQATLFARPFLSFFLDQQDIATASEVLSDPAALEELIQRLADERERN
jgi:hypothetical protein